MNHPGDLLSAYLDGELDTSERPAVRGHLAACGDCRAELESIASARSALRSLPTLPAPAELIPAPRVTSLASRRSRWRVVTAAAAVAAAAVFGVAAVRGGDEVPLDLTTVVEQHSVRSSVDPGVSMLQVSTVVGDR